MIVPLAAGLLLSTVIGLAGYSRGALSRSGVLGAIITGTPILAFGGLIWAILLVSFFVSSSALSHYRARFKVRLADKFQKGSRRDLAQALANGGWAAVLAFAFTTWHAPIIFAAFLGALATVTSDTWATEIGVLSTQMPRLISSGRPVPAGTSGGVTALGTATAFLGAAFIGVMAAVLLAFAAALPGLGLDSLGKLLPPSKWGALVLVTAISGLAGSSFDSLLGATLQGMYFCDFDQKETERRIHSCGRRTRLVRGYRWMDNDLVNFVSSFIGSGFAALIWGYLQRQV